MNDTIVVGDIHGKVEIVDAALSSGYKVVFVGDFLDSYEKNRGGEIQSLLKVMNAVQQHPDMVTALLGNHENSYLDKSQRCSGWNQETQSMIDAIGHARIKESLQPFAWVNGYLITHAGVSQNFLNQYGLTLDEYLAYSPYFKEVGKARGGFSRYGGHYWNDFFMEFAPIDGVKQIFGHTGWRPSDQQGSGILELDGNYLVDCFEHKQEFLLLRENGDVDKIDAKDLYQSKMVAML